MSAPCPPPAVFLSYASQDAEAARRLCEALRAAGVEVWFDQNELVGGDAWDAKIRQQIAACALFVPLISAATQARREGYFRLEWKLAAQRTHAMADGTPFLLPVLIDATRDAEALVPPEFKSVQWTRLQDPARIAPFVARVRRLLGDDATPPGTARSESAPTAPSPRGGHARGPRLALGAAGVIAAGVALVFALRPEAREAAPAPPPASPAAATAQAAPTTKSAPAPVSEARALAQQARALVEGLESNREDYVLAEELITRAKGLDSLDAEVYGVESLVHQRFLQRGWDRTDARIDSALKAAQRALRLDPSSFDARFTQVWLMSGGNSTLEEKERLFLELRKERPDSRPVLRALGRLVANRGRVNEALAFFDEAAALPGGDPLALYDKSQIHWSLGRAAEADRAIQAALAQQPFGGALLMAAWYRAVLHGDLDGAREFLRRMSPAQRSEARAAFFAFYIEMLARRPQAAIGALMALRQDWITDSWYSGPKGLLIGQALVLAKAPDAAAVEWEAALRLVEQKLAAAPNDWDLRVDQLLLLGCLGGKEELARQFHLLQQASGIDPAGDAAAPRWMIIGLMMLDRKEEAIRHLSLTLKLEHRAVLYTAAILKLDPIWDPLRSEPAFAQVVAEAEKIEAAAAASASAASGAASVPENKVP